MQNKLSVVIITKNEERFIADAIKSALFADEIVVVDSGSTDKTCDIAKKLGARVIFHEWFGYGNQKNIAIDEAKNDYVFVLDADERITPSLKKELLGNLDKLSMKVFAVPRLNRFFGKDIRYCGLYPDRSIRLFDRRYSRFNDVPVHESVQTKFPVAKLKNHMTHLAFESIREFRNKQIKYAYLSCRTNNITKAIISPFWVFFKIFFLKIGFMEGWRGFIIAIIYAEYTFRKYHK